MQGWRQAPCGQAVSWGLSSAARGSTGLAARGSLDLGHAEASPWERVQLAAGPRGVGELGWGRTAEALHPVRGSGKPEWVGSGEGASTKALASFSRHCTPLSQGARPPRTAAGEQQRSPRGRPPAGGTSHSISWGVCTGQGARCLPPV